MFRKQKNDTIIDLASAYQKALTANDLDDDPKQMLILDGMEKTFCAYQRRSPWRAFFSKAHLAQGIYLWGSVGSGKTFLMDLFYDALPTTRKMRAHFHQFMQTIHQALTQHQGKKNPLREIASDLATAFDFIALDEMFVEDIADAMLLGNLLKALYQKNIFILFTSNTKPDNLYWRGLQRAQFLPTIALLKNRNNVLNLNADCDYRLKKQMNEQCYFYPINILSSALLKTKFDQLAISPIEENVILTVADRPIHCRYHASNALWFHYQAILDIPRSTEDWLWLAAQKKIIFIAKMPVIARHQHHLIRNFIHFIDIIYEAQIRLVIQADSPLETLYQGTRFSAPWARALSRLHAMQSEFYS